MEFENTLGDFLRSRRARIDPNSAGLPTSGTPRRRKGLRREEVAALAGVSVDYYARLEQGRAGNVSDHVLASLEDALRMDQVEREHFRALVATQTVKPRPQTPRAPFARKGLRQVIDALDPVPALIQNRRMDVLAMNRAARVLLTDFESKAPRDRNLVRWLFLDPESRDRYVDWDHVASTTVATLRSSCDPRFPDRAVEELVGELSVASVEFARWWADYRLAKCTSGTKRIHHEDIGTLELQFESLFIPDSDGQSITVYSAPPGSDTEERLKLLLSWKADTPADPVRRDTMTGSPARETEQR